ncbi:MAG: nucleotidyl transferase AbiEii/AbiGii toxin family protein [Candidatus Moraniibacteriota bacterium]
MLTLEQIKSYYSGRALLFPENILVEYLQYELLDSIYKQKKSASLSFIGGTAIRIVHGSGRFSEDLDFDNFGLTFDEFEGLFKEVVRDMELKGFFVEFRFVEKGAYHCYIKFPHILHKEKLTRDSGKKILVRIDTVNKKGNHKINKFTLNKFDIYRKILVNSPDIILAQKMITILNRKREKGRDFYDVSYLFGKTQPDYKYIENYLQTDRKTFIQDLLKRCKEMDYSFLAKDVEPFLIDPSQSERVLDFYDFIKTKAKEV